MKKNIITAEKDGRKEEKIVYGDFQAFTVINLLKREGFKNIGMREENK